MNHERLAQTIVDALFVDGQGECAQRLVLMIDRPAKRDLGGWSRPAAIHVVAAVLREHAPRLP